MLRNTMDEIKAWSKLSPEQKDKVIRMSKSADNTITIRQVETMLRILCVKHINFPSANDLMSMSVGTASNLICQFMQSKDFRKNKIKYEDMFDRFFNNEEYRNAYCYIENMYCNAQLG
jgi:hypothetical protein